MGSGEERPRLVCRCLGVASPRIYAAARAQRLASVPEVTKAVRAGGGCGLCHPEIEEILAELRGEPVDPGVALENQLVCRQETRARVEASLESLIRPRLAALGATIGAVEVEGLRVRVRLGGEADAQAATLLTQQLRRLVCEDLEVEAAFEGTRGP
jgi:NifU-like protein